MKHFNRWGPLALVVTATVVLALYLARDPVKERWEDRAALPSCGSVVLSQGESLKPDAPSELGCLREGHTSGKGAELKVQWPTTEGDPIFTWYRALPSGGTESYEDSTEDAWGEGGGVLLIVQGPVIRAGHSLLR